jgi:hypothetical protein
MLRQTLVPMMALSMMISFTSESFAKGGGGSNSTTTSSTQIRLLAKGEINMGAAATAADINPEFHADYRTKKDIPQLKIRVENFEANAKFDVYIENLKIGSVVIDPVTLEGELDFKNGVWPAGLPTQLKAGMMVRILSGTAVLLQGAFQAK